MAFSSAIVQRITKYDKLTQWKITWVRYIAPEQPPGVHTTTKITIPIPDNILFFI